MFAFFRKLRSYAAEHAARWRAAGASRTAVVLNLAFTALIWAVLPLESEPLASVRRNKAALYPQVDFGRPRPLDPLRLVVQSLWLFVVRPPRGHRPHLVESTIAFIRWIGGYVNGAGDKFGHFALRQLRRFYSEDNKPSPAKLGPAGKAFVVVAAALGLALAVLCITQPFNLQGQVIFLALMFCSMVVLTRIQARITLMLLFVISIVVSGRYLWWRCTSTISTDGVIDVILSVMLLLAEIYAFIVMVLGYFQVCWVLDRKPYPLPADRSSWPTVDIFIPTYNEALDIIKPTVFAALNLDWPADKLRVYILDDGSRDSFKAFADEVGAGYIKREEHKHAKAGNINHALTVTSGELIVIFDCDHVPSCDFLTSTVGWLVKDKRIALVQTPHHFYSPDPFQKNLHLPKAMPIENSLFHDFIQKGNDTWNATMFCGSSAVIRRAALDEIGGIAIETVTEDAHTSLKLNRRGWSSAFIDRPVASGLSTESLSAHIGQRIRWARGMIQIFRLDNPMLGKGLTLAQRLCFFNAMIHFLHGLPRIIFLVAPLPYMFANIYIIYATAAAIFAYVVPHMVHSAVTNHMLQHGYRYPFLSSVYETILSWYILIPTTVALIFPHKGKFNVTAKGSTNDRKYLDWGISKPYVILIALNVLGLLIGFYKAFASPDPEYLTLAINMGWIAYNLMILGAAMAVAVEEVQTHRYPRVDLEVPAAIITADGKRYETQTEQYSQTEVRLAMPEALRGGALKEGDAVRLALTGEDGTETLFNLRAGRPEKGAERDFSVLFSGYAEERLFNSFTFSRRGMWAIPPKGEVDDRFLTGFMKLGELMWYGYKSMIEFLPGRVLPAIRDGIYSLLPHMPAAFPPELFK
ncbi:MAG: Cellulose synthase catalytic subunit [UDP-forming] [Burkholderia sp.]|jgi:cellulose synthase (UDP-forming)